MTERHLRRVLYTDVVVFAVAAVLALVALLLGVDGDTVRKACSFLALTVGAVTVLLALLYMVDPRGPG